MAVSGFFLVLTAQGGPLSQREAAKVAVYMYLNPLFSVLGSRLLLHEPVTPTLLAGGALIVGGVALANSRNRRRAVAI